MTTFQIVLSAVCGVAAIWVIVLLIGNWLANDLLFGLIGLITLGLVVNLVLSIIRVVQGDGTTSAVEYIGYAAAAVLLPVGATLWSLAERNRGGTAVLLVGVLLVPFMLLRMSEIWVG